MVTMKERIKNIFNDNKKPYRDILFEESPRRFHTVMYITLIRKKCTIGPKDEFYNASYYKGYELHVSMNDKVTYHITINGAECTIQYGMDEPKNVRDICEMLDELIATYKHGPSFALLRHAIIGAGVDRRDIIDNNGRSIDIILRDGSRLTFKPTDGINIPDISKVIKINY